jgi:hypothetical protein
MLTEQEQTFDTVQDWVESRREAREQSEQTQEVETETEEVTEEPETEEIEAEAEEATANEEISEDDPSEEEDLEASAEDSDEVDEPEAVEETPAAPAVEPPQHLKGDEREQFAKLPPEAQQMVAGLAKNGEALVTKKSQELSQTRQQLQQRLEGLGEYISEKEAQVQYYENVDWVAASQQLSPQEYQQHKAAHESLKAQLKEAKQKQSAAEVEEHKSFIQSRNTKLTELSESNPIAKALTDSKDGVTRQKEVFAYMHENGMDRETLLWVPAEGLTMAYKAMMYDRANKKAKELPTKQSATPKAKPAPKTVKSTPSTAQGSSTNQRLQTLSKKSVLSQEEFTEMRRLKRAKRKK